MGKFEEIICYLSWLLAAIVIWVLFSSCTVLVCTPTTLLAPDTLQQCMSEMSKLDIQIMQKAIENSNVAEQECNEKWVEDTDVWHECMEDANPYLYEEEDRN